MVLLHKLIGDWIVMIRNPKTKPMGVNKQYPLAVRTSTQMIVLKRADVTIIQILQTNMGLKQYGKKNLSFWIPIKKNKIHVAAKSKKTSLTTFQECLRSTLIIGQIFSLMPVNGIASNNPADVKFVKTSWKCIYSFLSFLGQIYMTMMCAYRVMIVTSLKSTSPVIFYSTTLITMAMFVQMAKSWPSLVQHIAKTEEIDPNIDDKLYYKCNITCVVVLSLALLEHILSLLSAFAAAMVCYPNENLYEGFVKHFYPWVFNYIPYTPALGGFTQLMHFQSTFVWNFTDLFVICISYYLTSRLDQVNKKLLAAQGKYLPEVFWKTSREDYGRVTQLIRRTDEVISGIVFISFANNLFFICLQLFNSLDDGIKGNAECSVRSKEHANKSHIFGGYESAAYFLFSLIFLIGRSIAVSLIAAQVNTASNVPAPILYDVPSPVYCIEVQRFLDQVNGDNIALSGLQFFVVTRGLLLTIAGTIITYELVMVQFNSSPEPSSPENATTSILSLMASTTPTTE